MAKSSFISNFKKAPWAAVTLIVIALLFEVFNRVYDHRLYPSPYDGLRMALKNQVSQSRENDFDVLIMGDCFNMEGIHPRIIEKLTGLKVFNYGTHSDYTIFTSYLFLKNHLTHASKKPKIIVINYIPELIAYSEKSFDNRALPFLFHVKDGNFSTLVQEIGFDRTMHLQFYTLKHKGFFTSGRFLKGLADPESVREYESKVASDGGHYGNYGDMVYKGYYPPNNNVYGFKPSDFFEKYLRKILQLARDNDMIVMFPMFTAPIDEYQNFYSPSHMVEITFAFLAKLKKDYPNLVVWGWQDDFSSREIYRDATHLNRRGWTLMSLKIAETISRLRQEMGRQ